MQENKIKVPAGNYSIKFNNSIGWKKESIYS